MTLKDYVSCSAAALYILGASFHLCCSEAPPDLFPQNPNEIIAASANATQNSTRIKTRVDASYQLNLPQCMRAKQGDTQPWVHKSKVLSSFPRDNPAPRFLGAFRDRPRLYQLKLYRDSSGIFGELSSPLLDADSPTSRLYDVYFEPGMGTLKFRARFADEQLDFNGVLRSTFINGTVRKGSYTEAVSLRRDQHYDQYPYVSRVQFNCAMLLFNRY